MKADENEKDEKNHTHMRMRGGGDNGLGARMLGRFYGVRPAAFRTQFTDIVL